MELLKITPSDSRLWEQVWRLYNDSFPQYERRRISSHARACEDNDFHTYIVVENGNLLALLFYWTYDSTIYIEHLAVSPQLRGRSIGSRLIADFFAQHPGAEIILEIDPPVDEVSRRRLAFYERLGFKDSGRVFRHPSYRRGGTGHDLLVLSYPEAPTDEQYDRFMEYVTEKVLKYID